MYNISIGFHDRLMRGETPIPYIVVNTHMGYRAYAEKEMTGIFDIEGLLADGTYLADGSHTAGSESVGVLEKSGRVIRLDSFDRSLQPLKENILGGYRSKALQHFTVDLENSDRYFARLIASEPFIGRPLKCYVGFEDISQSEHLEVFSGVITEMSVMPIMTLEADEE